MYLPWVVVPPPYSQPVTGRCNLFRKVWVDTLELSPWHLKALEAMPIDSTSSPKWNRPFDSSIKYPAGSKERLACTKALHHYLKIGLVRELLPETSNGLWSTFFPVPKKGTGSWRGCVAQPPVASSTSASRWRGFTPFSRLIRRNNLITKVDLSDFCMHFLIGKANCRYMRFMWEAGKYQCIGMPFDLALARGWLQRLWL